MKQYLITEDKLTFILFSIEAYAEHQGISSFKAYLIFDSYDLINYIINNYDVLHTQGKEWLVNEFIAVINQKKIKKE